MALTPDQLLLVDPAPPQWLAQETIAMQAQADHTFANLKTSYLAASAQWISAQKFNLENGLPVVPFTVPLPTREVLYPLKPGSLEVWLTEQVADPGLSPPKLPSAVPLSPAEANKGTQLSTGTDPVLIEIVKRLSALQLRLEQLFTLIAPGGH